MEKLSVKEAMEQLNLSETTIRRMIKRGDLPNTFKEDRKIWIPQSDIDAYLQQQQSGSSPESPSEAVPSAPAEIIPEEPPLRASEPEAVPEPRSIIAQPIEELDDGTDQEEVQEPVPYTPGSVQTSGEHEQSFKWIVVQAGILSTKWLEEIFHSIRTALEKYKKKSFPNSDDNK